MPSDLIIYIFVFIFGLMIGSFLNVVIYRVPAGISIVRPGSRCPSCETQLAWKDLVPVMSYLFLRGRCRYCKTPISSRYSLVEIATGLLSAALYVVYGPTIDFIAMLVITYILIPCFFIDLEHMIIPNGLVITGLVSAVVLIPVRKFVYHSEIAGNLYGGLFGGGILLLIYLAGYAVYKKEALGFGDVKLFFVVGLFLGLKLTILAFLFSIFSGALVGIYLLAVKKSGRTAEMPFGPFIVFGSLLSIFTGELVYNWYIGLLM